MEGHGDAVTELKGIRTAVADLNARLEDRNRTVPVPFCGNRFEFCAVGSSQYIGFPLAVLNNAVENLLVDNVDAIFNGDGYSDD